MYYSSTMYLRVVCNQFKNSNLQHQFITKGRVLPLYNILTNGTKIYSSLSAESYFVCPKYNNWCNYNKFPNNCRRYFHVTAVKTALPPILWVVLRGVLKFAAVVTGRGLRKWWAALPKNKKCLILNKLYENRKPLAFGTVFSGGAVLTYYITHLVEDPITKRKKFLIFSENQILQMAKIECEVVLENYEKSIITSGYHYNRVLRIANRILQANKHLHGAKRSWQVFIIDDIDTRNAFVLPSGHIFIFTGMLATVSNDDQLAAILAHEMAHALLSHAAEVASKTHLFELLLLIPVVALWTLLPDSMALSSHYFTEYISSVLFQLPMSRKLEVEADKVGLEMATRACFDPRQASAFWKKMETLSEESNIEWLSTHPSHKTRYEMIDDLMPEAIGILAHYCTRPDMDPRLPRPLPNNTRQIVVL